jgi:tRNA U34 5-methylaminomethyl-2-thiouridine-forming methyltransferase MnmC
MKVIKTEDGSTTLYLEELDETYHSRHGAIQEAMHVFIKNGLEKSDKNPVRIFEMGFGTGLNAFLTYIKEKHRSVYYTGIEKYPVPDSILEEVKYWEEVDASKEEFLQLHESDWGEFKKISDSFHLRKLEDDLSTFSLKEEFDLIYYDAFGPRAQDEMWQKEVLEKVVNLMAPEAIFVTYCAKGQVRRDLQELGLDMERVPGPPGKREMLVGRKVSEW